MGTEGSRHRHSHGMTVALRLDVKFGPESRDAGYRIVVTVTIHSSC
jgi:hypothetical protein